MNILDRIVNWFRVKRFMMTHKTKLFLWQSDGRKYLAVHECSVSDLIEDGA